MRVFTLFEKVKQLLDDGAVGRPLHLRLDLWRRPYRAGAGGWKADPAKVGSSILEEPVHYLDLARYYLTPTHGEPTRVSAWATSRPGREGQWENLDIRLTFGGAEALLTRSIAAYGHTVTLHLVGERGAMRAEWRGAQDLDPAPEQRLWLHASGDRDALPEVVPVPTGGHAFDLPRQTRAFMDAVRRGSAPPATAEDGLASVALSLAVEAALSRGEAVRLEQM
jgi:myo-inositol 2-dehydrogenase / D-chiro-inositol 1-dehydrogenase